MSTIEAESLAFVASPVPQAVYDWEGHKLVSNRRFAAMFGDAQPGFAELFHADDRGAAARALEVIHGGGEVPTQEHRFCVVGGGHRLLRWSLAADPDARQVVMVWMDAGSELAELRQMKHLVDAIPDLIGYATLDGVAVYVNPHGLKMLDRPPNTGFGYHIAQTLPPRLQAFFGEVVIPAVMRDGVWSGESEFVRADGTTFPVDQVIVTLPDASGQPTLLATRARDISEQKRLEVALQAQIQELSTPIIQLWDGVLALPLVGMFDKDRAAQTMDALLRTITESRSHFAALDVTGITTVDTDTVDALLRMIRAGALLGCRCILSGVSPTMAQTMTQLGVDLTGFQAFRSLQEALRHAMQLQAKSARVTG